jgi:hypothetical protein
VTKIPMVYPYENLSWVSSLSTGRLPKYKQMKMTIKNCTELNLSKRKEQS